MTKPILLLNGANLNLLGTREPHIYGSTSLEDVEEMCTKRAKEHGLEIVCRQSNHEGQLVDWIQEAITGFSAVIINPGAYTHTSVAILDSLKNVKGPIIELHVSHPHQREAFRHVSYVSLAATGTICGLGVYGYVLAVDAVAHLLKTKFAKQA
jgi:3-dehydroquinate dehydratase-2